MANDSMLIGDLSSQVAQLNGKIKGNIEISGKIMLDRDSVIIGDIKAGSIAISDGAVINGFVTTTYLSKDESGGGDQHLPACPGGDYLPVGHPAEDP